MKKKGLAALCALAALLLAAGAFCAGAWLRGGVTMTAELPPLEAGAQRDFMRADLVYDAGTRTLRGTQTITATNRTDAPLSEIVLRLHANGQSAHSAAVTGVKTDGQSMSFEQDEDDATLLRIALDWQPGQTVELSWTLMLTHPKTDGAVIVTLPALSMLKGGEWQTDAYDALVDAPCTQAFDYALTLIARDDTKAAFGGALTAARWETGVGETLYSAQMQGARDVSFALMPGGKTRQAQVGGVLVTALASSASQAGKLLDCAGEAMESLEGMGLAYPFPALTVVSADTGREDGAALSGLIALGGDEKKETLLRRMTRLIARQIFGVLAGYDAYGAPWLSHTLASTAELLAFRMRKGEAAFETRFFEEIEVATRLTRPYGVTVGAGVDRFGSDAEMTQVLRDQGAAMLLGIGEAIGYDALAQALCAYAADNAYEIADRQDFEAALESAGAGSWTGYFDDELSY